MATRPDSFMTRNTGSGELRVYAVPYEEISQAREYITALEAENAALRELVKAMLAIQPDAGVPPANPNRTT